MSLGLVLVILLFSSYLNYVTSQDTLVEGCDIVILRQCQTITQEALAEDASECPHRDDHLFDGLSHFFGTISDIGKICQKKTEVETCWKKIVPKSCPKETEVGTLKRRVF